MHLYEAAIGIVAALAVPAVIIGLGMEPRPGNPHDFPGTAEIGETVMDFPLTGEFLASGSPAAAPVVKKTVPAFMIMKRQVSLADYGRCVADGACVPADAAPTEAASTQAAPIQADVPVTGVNVLDA